MGYTVINSVLQSVVKDIFPSKATKAVSLALQKQENIKLHHKDKLLEHCTTISRDPRLKNTMERQTARNLLCKALGEPDIFPSEGGNIDQPVSKQKGRENWKQLNPGKWLNFMRHSPDQFDLNGMDLTLRFILSLNHISMLSWGEKKVRLDLWETVSLPVITLRLTPKLMLQAYKVWTEKTSDLSAFPTSKILFSRVALSAQVS